MPATPLPHAPTFTDLDDVLAHALAADRNVVLTPNERLSRELANAFDVMRAQQDTAWVPAQTSSWAEYVAREYHALRAEDEARPRVVSELELQLLLRSCAPASLRPLLSAAVDAWSMTHRYGLNTSEHLCRTDNGRQFYQWLNQTQSMLSARRSVSAAELPAILSAARGSTANETLTLLEFDRLDASQAALLNSRPQAQVTHHTIGTKAAESVCRLECMDAAEEVNFASRWAHDVLARDPGATVGIVVPGLTNRHGEVERQVGVNLDPDRGSASPLFNISGGIPLASHPLLAEAALLLRLCFEPLSMREVDRLRRGGSFDLGVATVPEDFPGFVDLTALGSVNPQLRPLIDRASACPSEQSLGRWIAAFNDLLGLASWGSSRTASVRYQARTRISELMQRIQAFESGRKIGPTAAIATLQQLASLSLFARERPLAPVQVLGQLETVGMRFTHLWVCGLSADDFPAPPNLNPFIPTSTRRELGVPRSTPEDEYEHAERLLQRWLDSAQTVVLSHGRHSIDGQLGPSPLTVPFAHVEPPELLDVADGARHPYLCHPPVDGHLERWFDDRAPPIAPGPVRGGTGVLRTYAQCPFKAWAVYRAGAGEVREPHSFPDALDRGTLVHEALKRLGAHVVDQTSAASMDASALRSIAERTVNQLFERFPDDFRVAETARVTRVLQAWLALEQTRGPFEVISVEQSQPLQLDGWTYQLRLDRVDRVDQRLLIIDYKTGVIRLTGVTGQPLLEPQLAAYAEVLPDVGGVAYAHVSDNPALLGVVDDNMPDDLVPRRRISATQWHDQQLAWARELRVIARGFGTGNASVTPAKRTICDGCHVRSACRIDALRVDP